MNTYIKDALSVRGIAQRKLAERLGVTQATISAIISRPSFPTLERIATALDVEPWQLLAPPSIIEELKQAKKQKTLGAVVAWWASCVSAVISTQPTPCSSSAPSSRGWNNGTNKAVSPDKQKKSRQGANLIGITSDNFPSCQTNKINLKYNGRRQLTGETVQSVYYLLFLCLSRFLASVHIGPKLFLIYPRDTLHTCKRYKATVII